MDGKTSHCVKDLSKLTKIEELREKLEELFDAAPERQRLFYRGKQVRVFYYQIILPLIYIANARPFWHVLL
jgi:hypothetical protein